MRVLACASGLSPIDLERVRAAVESGELLVYPTDTLYALGGLVLRADAARRVREAKGREAGKALPAVAADLEQVGRLCSQLPAGAEALGRAFWPGPLTLVLPAAAGVPSEVTCGRGTIAVRVPDRELTRGLCRLAGPLVSTSANRAGEAPALSCAEAVVAVGAAVALALDAGPGTTTPSTIVDTTGDRPKLVRAGAVPWEAVLGSWS